MKSIVVLLGKYCSLPYNKISEMLYDLTNNVVNLSEGTIDNIYEKFFLKTKGTIANITNNLMNSTYQHTDNCYKLEW